MMKEIKQSMKRKRWLQFPKIIVVVLVVMLIAVFLSSCSNNQPALNVLKKKQFVMIKMGDSTNEHFEVGVDLEKKEYYYNDETAVKDDTVYGGYKADWDRKQYYKSAVNNELSSVLLSKKITTDEIKKSNYQITSSPKRFLDDKLMKEEYPPEFEAIYLKKNRQFTKVRITYNKEFLPTRIEWYYKGEEGLKWYTAPIRIRSKISLILIRSWMKKLKILKRFKKKTRAIRLNRSKFLKRVPSFTLSGKVSCKMLEKVV